MTALTDARARLAAGYYNSNPKSVANPGGLATNGHQVNFPAACADIGLVANQAGLDAAALAAAMPTITAGANAAVDAATYRDQAKAYRDQAQEIVGGDLSLKANIASPAFTGTPTAPTPAQSDNTNRLATTAYVVAKFAALIGAAPSTLDALNELAAALGNDPNFAASMANALGLKFDKAGGAINGSITLTDPVGVQKNISWDYAGAPLYLYGGANGVGLYDNQAGAGSVWAYNRSTKALDLKAGATAGGSVIYTAANLLAVDTISPQNLTGVKSFVTPNLPMTSTGAVGAALMAMGTSTGPAMMAFHRPGIFATHFGIDSDNQLKVGGWSNGANAYVMFHQGNDGAGSGLDADLFRGAAPDTAGSANTIVKRNGEGAIDAPILRNGGGNLILQYGTNARLTAHANGVSIVGAVDVSGGLTAQGAVTGGSDRKLKADIRDLEPVAGLVPRRFTREGVERLGYIAQEVLECAPEAVHHGPDFLSLEALAMIAAVHAQINAQLADLSGRLAQAGF